MKGPSIVKAFYGIKDLWTRLTASINLINGTVYQEKSHQVTCARGQKIVVAPSSVQHSLFKKPQPDAYLPTRTSLIKCPYPGQWPC